MLLSLVFSFNFSSVFVVTLIAVVALLAVVAAAAAVAATENNTIQFLAVTHLPSLFMGTSKALNS